MKDFAKVMRNKVSKKKKKTPEHPSKGRFIPIEMEDAAPSDGEDEWVKRFILYIAGIEEKLWSAFERKGLKY